MFTTGKLREKAVAVGQLVDQHAPLGTDLAYLPLAAAVEHRQLAAVPVPVARQALQQQALPALAVVARWAAELLVDLEVQAAADQLQALVLATGLEEFLQAAVDHDIEVELIDIQAIGESRLLEAQRQALDLGAFTGVNLGEQQLEHRLVGRLEALEQLPHAGADKLFRRDACKVAEVEHVLGADKALGQQGARVVLIALLFNPRPQPPQRRAPA